MKVTFTTQNIVPNMIIALLIYFTFDAIYLKLAKNIVYPKEFLKDADIKFGFIAWIALAFAVAFVKCERPKDAFLFGGFIGFVSYAVFNGTTLAISKAYRQKQWYIDMLYGTMLSGVVCYALEQINK